MSFGSGLSGVEEFEELGSLGFVEFVLGTFRFVFGRSETEDDFEFGVESLVDEFALSVDGLVWDGGDFVDLVKSGVDDFQDFHGVNEFSDSPADGWESEFAEFLFVEHEVAVSDDVSNSGVHSDSDIVDFLPQNPKTPRWYEKVKVIIN